MAYDASRALIDAFAVTTSDSVKINAYRFYVGVSGDVTVMPAKQEAKATPVAVTFKAHPVGWSMELEISRFMATGTTATNIIALGPS